MRAAFSPGTKLLRTSSGRRRLSLAMLAAGAVMNVPAQNTGGLRLVVSIPLEGVSGRIDHMAIDRNGNRLFIAALGSNAVEVLDLKTHRIIRSIRDLREPQGICYLGDLNALAVANGGDGTCRIFDASSFRLLHSVDLSEDADNIRFDSARGLLAVGAGDGTLAFIDPASGTVRGSVSLAAHPESFQLERDGHRIFVNLPDADQIAVLDRQARKILDTVVPDSARSNFPMALDDFHHRLFVGCRRPARLLAFATDTLRQIASLPVCGDADDLWYDRLTDRIFLSCGEGFIAVVKASDNGSLRMSEKIPTAPGARTSLYIPEQKTFYLAVPARGARRAEIRIYAVQN